MPEFFAEFLDEDPEDSAAVGVLVPGVYASLVPWAEAEYARSGDPRVRFRCPPEVPEPNPNSTAGLRLRALEAEEPVVVSMWIASGRRFGGTGWSDPVFDLPWDHKVVRSVLVDAADYVRPHDVKLTAAD